MRDTNSRLVYSTDGEHIVSETPSRKATGRKPSTRRPADRAAPPADGVVRVQRETKGRRGKTVTVISGLPGSERDLEALLKALKQHCGAGGARDGAILELQGDHRDRVVARLEALGHRVKLAGG